MKGILRQLEAMNPEARYSLWGSMTNVQDVYKRQFYTEQQQAIQAGCNAVISKPYSLEKLKETIESYIG